MAHELIHTGMYSRQAEDILITALAFYPKLELFSCVFRQNIYRDKTREIVIVNGIELNKYDGYSYSHKKTLILDRLKNLQELCDEDGVLTLWIDDRNLYLYDIWRNRNPLVSRRIQMTKKELRIVQDLIDEKNINDMIAVYGVEDIDRIVGNSADPLLAELREYALEKTKRIIEQRKTMLSAIKGINENSKLEIESIEKQTVDEISNVWKFIGDQP